MLEKEILKIRRELVKRIDFSKIDGCDNQETVKEFINNNKQQIKEVCIKFNIPIRIEVDCSRVYLNTRIDGTEFNVLKFLYV